MIPAWVLKLLEQAAADAWTGTIAISYRGGAPHHAKREEIVHAPAEPRDASRDAYRCPVDGQPMQSADYGNLWICRCGVKRTLAQISKSAPRAN